MRHTGGMKRQTTIPDSQRLGCMPWAGADGGFAQRVMRLIGSAAACAILALIGLYPDTALAQGHASLTCRFPQPIPPEAKTTTLVIFGEIHGTNESPAVAAEFACSLLAENKPVVLALEIPPTEQAAIDKYLASSGASIDRLSLVAGSTFWEREFQDGRSSIAMLALIERVRQLQATTHSISIVAIDGTRPGSSRDASMALNLRDAIERTPSATLVALVGNVHAIKAKGRPGAAWFQSMAYHLNDQHPFTVSVEFKTGASWSCRSQCGIAEFGEKQTAHEVPDGFDLGRETFAQFDAVFLLKHASAAIPAVSALAGGQK